MQGSLVPLKEQGNTCGRMQGLSLRNVSLTVFESGKLWAKVKAWITLVVPLVIGAMRRAQMMGVAMDTRAFGANKKRTCLSELHLQKSDIIAGIILFFILGSEFFINYKPIFRSGKHTTLHKEVA